MVRDLRVAQPRGLGRAQRDKKLFPNRKPLPGRALWEGLLAPSAPSPLGWATQAAFALIMGIVWAAALSGSEPAAPAKTEKTVPANAEVARFFEEKIRPALVDRCYSCHSVEKGKHKGGLLVDSRAALLSGGQSGPAVVPGKPEDSLLIKAIKQLSDDMKMPPEDHLSPQQVADFERWVRDGAFDPRPSTLQSQPVKVTDVPVESIKWDEAKKFWSFVPVKSVPPPIVQNKAWCKTAIDQFILQKLEEKKLAPAPLASKQTLLRRVTLDLTGLPPTPEEIDAFVADAAPNAFEKVVDRLLASPRYGECWGRHWLDLARYADTAGESADYPVPQAYKYRNYVIDSFNADVPYDRFIKEQLAGDLLPAKDDAEHYKNIVATGFVALSRRFSVAPENEMHLTIDDTLDTMGRSMLGLTLSCSRCHDHKFDPLTMKDYYALYGFFSSSGYPYPGSETRHHPADFVPLDSKERIEKELKPFNEKLAAFDAEIKKLEEARKIIDKLPAGKDKDQQVAENKKTQEVKRKERKEFQGKQPNIPLAYAMREGTAKDAHIHKRGEAFNIGDEVPRRFPQILGGQTLPPSVKNSGRLQLAEWIADSKNPLTARVMANRVWQYHFGRGIVATPSDFGKQGKPPTHPELLDYLATRLVDLKWSVKALHKEILLSQVYQLASDGPEQSAAADPTNEWFWRYNRHRLDAEAIRDGMLVIAGNLDPSRGEGHPFPPQNTWEFSQHNQFQADYPSRKRSVYLMQQRIKRHPFLALFDGADTNVTTAQRALTTSPIQALFMMNDPFTHDEGEYLAVRLMKEEPDESKRFARAIRLTYGRDATADEIERGRQFIARYRELSKATPFPADQYEQMAWGAYARVLMCSNEFVFVE